MDMEIIMEDHFFPILFVTNSGLYFQIFKSAMYCQYGLGMGLQ